MISGAELPSYVEANTVVADLTLANFCDLEPG
jgi:hypothetical protein